MQLRDYQKECLRSVIKGLKNNELNQLVVAATGTGKTVTFCSLPKILKLTKPTLILAGMDSLLHQAIKQWKEVHGESSIVGLEQGSNHIDEDVKYDAIFASVQTLKNERLSRLLKRDFGLIIYDEAHHSEANTSQALLEALGCLPLVDSKRPSGASLTPLIGFTATPDRADKKSLSTTFPYKAYDYGTFKALENGHWSPVRARRVLTNTDLTEVGVRNGEYIEKELDILIVTPTRNSTLIDAWEEEGGLKGKTAVFCSTKAQALSLFADFAERAKSVYYIDGTTKNRQDALAQFETDPPGAVLINIRVLSEGVNIRPISHVIMAGPVHSPVQMEQSLGRGTRPFKGKKNLTVLYSVDKTKNNVKLCSVASLLGLPHSFDLEGEDLLETRNWLEDLVGDSPITLQSLIESRQVPDTRRELEEALALISLYCPTNLMGVLAGHTPHTWVVNDVEAMLSGDIESAEKYIISIPEPLHPQRGESSEKRQVHLQWQGDQWECIVTGPTPEKAAIQRKMKGLRAHAGMQQNQFLKFRLFKSLAEMRETEQAMPDQVLQTTKLGRDVYKAVEKIDNAIVRNLPSAQGIVRLDAKWRTAAPTKSQLGLAKKLKIPVPKDANKGLITLLIDNRLRRQREG